MKINLKFGTKKEPVQTGLQVHTHMLAGSPCEDMCKQMYPPIKGLDLGLHDPRLENIFFYPRLDNCLSACKAYDRPM